MVKSRKRKQGSHERSGGHRDIIEHSSAAYLQVSFALIDFSQPAKVPQDFNSWQEDGLLAPLMDKVRRLNQLTFLQAQQQQLIAVYSGFPKHSQFTVPQHVDKDVNWGVIKSVGGQKSRVAGYIEQNVFYCVFLDQHHQFYPTEKKRT
jgi:hypothetical protein